MGDVTPVLRHYTLPVHGRVICLTRFYLYALYRARRAGGRTLLVGRVGRWQVRQMDSDAR